MLSRLTNEKWSTDDLGVARIIFFFLLLISFSGDQMTRYSDFALSMTCLDRAGVWLEIWLTPLQAAYIVNIFYVGAFLSMVGLFTRASMTVTAAAAFLLLLNSWKYCFLNHSHLPILLPLIFWALLDDHSGFRLENRIRRKPANVAEARPWLPLSIRGYFGVVFFLTAIAKLRSGLDWITEDSLRHMLIVQNFGHSHMWAVGWFRILNDFLASQIWLCRGLAVFTVIAEIAAPIALFSRRLRTWIVLDLALLQIGIFVVMYINFAPWSTMYVFWLPLARITAKLRKWNDQSVPGFQPHIRSVDGENR